MPRASTPRVLARRGAARRLRGAACARAAARSCASGSTRPGTSASRSSWPTRPARSRRSVAPAERRVARARRPARIRPSARDGRVDRAAARARRASSARRAASRRATRPQRSPRRSTRRPRERFAGVADGAVHDRRATPRKLARGSPARRALQAALAATWPTQVAPARGARRAPAHGAAGARAARRVRRAQARARPGRHDRPRARARWRCCATATLAGWVQERLDARVRHLLIDEFQDTSPLQWQALHGWLVGLRRRRRRRERAAAAGRLHRRRSQAEHLPLPPRRAARVRGGARASCAKALGGSVLACDHTRRNAPRGDRGDQRGVRRGAGDGEFAGFRAHTTEVGADAASGVSRCRASTAAAAAERAAATTRRRRSGATA